MRCRWYNQIACQQKFAVTNIMLTAVPSLGYSKRRKFIQVNSLQKGENKSALPWDKGEACLYREVPTMVPDWYIFMQMRNPNIHSNSDVLIGQNCVSWFVIVELLLLVSKNTNEDIAMHFSIGQGRSQLIGQNTISGTPYKGWLNWKSVQEAWPLVCGFPLICSVCERPLSAMAVRL